MTSVLPQDAYKNVTYIVKHLIEFVNVFFLLKLASISVTSYLFVKFLSGILKYLLETNMLNYTKMDRSEISNFRFKDICGNTAAKKELKVVVNFLLNPTTFNNIGARPPKGVLLIGPPGVGKKLLAKAVAGEAGVPFFQCSGSQFDENFVGTGAARVRKLFQEAKAHAPCVVFIDEFDYANQTVKQLLAQMDGFSSTDVVIVLAATNRVDHLDTAVLRPRRFDIHVNVDLPDVEDRKEILRRCLSKVKFIEDDIDIGKLSKMTMGLTNEEIKNIVNQAAMLAVIEGSKCVQWEHMQTAFDKVTMGVEGRAVKSVQENRNTAAHEAGHTVVAWFTKGAAEVNKVTILPRGQSLGHLAFVPSENDEYSRSKAQMLAELDVSMGGRLGEEFLLGADNVTSGSSSDFQEATSLATLMVLQYGMSERFGFVITDDSKSVEDRKVAYEEVKRLLDESMERARRVLMEHKNEHRRLTEALLKHKTLDKTDIQHIMNDRTLQPNEYSEFSGIVKFFDIVFQLF